MLLLPEFFPGATGFQWYEGNSEKNWLRYFALGWTDTGRELMVAFTLRSSLLRVISARPMSRRERRVYGEAKGG